MLKRIFDLAVSFLGLLILLPFFVIIAILIRVDSSGPVFFRQERVGLDNKIFKIHKFRTMCVGAEQKGLQITTGRDQRITKIGAWLRKYKIDELPQLIDVLYGAMSIVGPRPEVRKYVDMYPPEVRNVVLSVRPGITDNASIEFRSENEILGKCEDPERVYVETVLPIKLHYYEQYVKDHSLVGDIKIIARTILAILN